MEVEPICFANREGVRLFGMLHANGMPRRDWGIIILSPGIKSRVAPHRMYVKMAEKYCHLGFPTLRFDPAGLGDSEGEIEEKFAADVYASIQVGRFIADTVDAMNWMQARLGLRRFILAGLCGGAITGLLSGAGDERIGGLIALGIPVILDGSDVDKTKYITQGQLRGMRGKYLRKMFEPKSWWRLITFQTNYRTLAKSMAQPLGRLLKTAASQGGAEQPSGRQGGPSDDGNFNPYFPEAFFRMARDRKLFFIFSGADRLYWEYEEKFMRHYAQRSKGYKENVRLEIIPEANHILSFPEWFDAMLAMTADWLGEHFMDPSSG